MSFDLKKLATETWGGVINYFNKLKGMSGAQRILHLFLGLSIRIKISIIMILVLSTGVIIVSNSLFNKQKTMMLEEMKQRGTVLSKNLVTAGFQSIANKDMLISSDTISAIMKEKGIVYCKLIDKNGKVVDSSITKEAGKIPKDDISIKLLSINKITFNTIVSNDSSILDVASPIMVEYKDKRALLGYGRIGMDWGVVEKEIRNLGWSIFFLSLIILSVGVIISFLFATTITGPLRQMVDVMKKVDEGDLNQTVKVHLIDEIGKLADAMNAMIQHLREKMMMSKYISKSAHAMISGRADTNLKLGGKRKTVTLFFSDIRGFTSFSENKSPEDVISMLNTYLSVQAEIIDKNGGSIDKFVGDEVVAVFEGEGMVDHAVASAITIQEKILAINKKLKAKIGIGIGINTGEVVMGNMGSKNRMDYTVIGDNVNAAARLCSAAEAKEILVSEASYLLVKKKTMFVNKPREISVKGKKQAIKVYSVK